MPNSRKAKKRPAPAETQALIAEALEHLKVALGEFRDGVNVEIAATEALQEIALKVQATYSEAAMAANEISKFVDRIIETMPKPEPRPRARTRSNAGRVSSRPHKAKRSRK